MPASTTSGAPRARLPEAPLIGIRTTRLSAVAPWYAYSHRTFPSGWTARPCRPASPPATTPRTAPAVRSSPDGVSSRTVPVSRSERRAPPSGIGTTDHGAARFRARLPDAAPVVHQPATATEGAGEAGDVDGAG